MPNEFQEVGWIGSSGTQYIVTDSRAFRGLKIVFDIIHTVAQSGTEVALNVNVNTTGWVGFKNNLIRVDSATLPTNIFERHTYTITYSNNFTLQDDLGNSASFDASTHNVNLSIFATHTGAYKAKFRAYSFKFYDTTNNDELVRDLIPCYRKSDNEIGMYDIVTKTFFTNQGTGSFTKGPQV